LKPKVIKYSFLLIILTSYPALSQDKFEISKSEESSELPELVPSQLSENNSLNESVNQRKEILYRYRYDPMEQSRRIMKEENRFNIVSSFRSNIRFGGFYDRYAIVNFTPQMSFKPAEFISVYAHHNISYFVPIQSAKEHFTSMAAQGAAILAVDNIVKHILPAGIILRSITGFILKNTVIHFMTRSILGKGNDKVLEYDFYYYSVSIRL
jgi:hypothetical protein